MQEVTEGNEAGYLSSMNFKPLLNHPLTMPCNCLLTCQCVILIHHIDMPPEIETVKHRFADGLSL